MLNVKQVVSVLDSAYQAYEEADRNQIFGTGLSANVVRDASVRYAAFLLSAVVADNKPNAEEGGCEGCAAKPACPLEIDTLILSFKQLDETQHTPAQRQEALTKLINGCYNSAGKQPLNKPLKCLKKKSLKKCKCKKQPKKG